MTGFTDAQQSRTLRFAGTSKRERRDSKPATSGVTDRAGGPGTRFVMATIASKTAVSGARATGRVIRDKPSRFDRLGHFWATQRRWFLKHRARSEVRYVVRAHYAGHPRPTGDPPRRHALAPRSSVADCWLLNHASRGHAGWLAAAVGNQRQAMLVLALRVRKHRALGDLHPPRRRRESNGVLTRAVEGDGMQVR
jgi:hypothetical protein